MNRYAFIPLVAFLINAFTWMYVFARERRTPVNNAFLLFSGTLSAWALLEFLTWLHIPEGWEEILLRLQPLTWLNVGFLFLHFVYTFLGRRRDAPYFLSMTAMLLSLPLPILTDWLYAGYQRVYWGAMEESGPLYIPLTVTNILLSCVYACYLVFRRLRITEDVTERKQLKLLLAGMTITLTLGYITDVVLPDILGIWDFPNLAPSLTIIFALCVYRAVAQYNFMSLGLAEAAFLMFEHARDGVLLFDRRHHVRLNRAAKELLHTPDVEANAVSALALIQPPKNVEQGESYEITVGEGAAQRTLIVVQYPIEKVETELGRLVILHDVTERRRGASQRRRLEEQLAQAQKMEAMGRLAGGVAHDFNNLLSVILGYAELAKQELHPTVPALRDLAAIAQAARKGANLTRQLLAFSRKEVIKPEIIELNALVSDTEKMLQRVIGEDIMLTTTLQDGLGCVEVDRGQMEQVLMNMAVNARDAMPGGGKLRIETRRVSDEWPRSPLGLDTADGPYAQLTISDTGTGIDPEHLDQIFEPFFTTKEAHRGTGLGLSTAYGIVKQAGGEILVSSTPGAGTTFDIYLPLASRADGKGRSPTSPLPVTAAQNKTVLVVEDEETVRLLTQRILESQGYTVVTAPNGAEALALAQDHRGPIHLLLTDVIMPGMSGAELARRAKPVRPEMQIMFMSGYADEVMARHGFDKTGVVLVRKPFSAAQLLSHVRNALLEPRTTA